MQDKEPEGRVTVVVVHWIAWFGGGKLRVRRLVGTDEQRGDAGIDYQVVADVG